MVLRLVLVHEPDPAGREEGQAPRALRRAGLGLELGGCQVLETQDWRRVDTNVELAGLTVLLADGDRRRGLLVLRRRLTIKRVLA